MEQEKLLALLQELQAEVGRSSAIEPETRGALESVAQRIHRQLAGEAEPGDEPSAAGRLHDLLLEFETEHPELTRLVNQVSAALANLGI